MVVLEQIVDNYPLFAYYFYRNLLYPLNGLSISLNAASFFR